jgi:hypothetical protein
MKMIWMCQCHIFHDSHTAHGPLAQSLKRKLNMAKQSSALATAAFVDLDVSVPDE